MLDIRRLRDAQLPLGVTVLHRLHPRKRIAFRLTPARRAVVQPHVHPGARILVRNEIFTVAAAQPICAGAADQQVCAVAAIQPVVSLPTVQLIVTAQAIQPVCVLRASQYVRVSGADQVLNIRRLRDAQLPLGVTVLHRLHPGKRIPVCITAPGRAGVQPRLHPGARPPVRGKVLPGASAQRIRAGGANEPVIPAGAVQLVVPGAAIQRLVTLAPNQRVRAGAAGQLALIFPVHHGHPVLAPVLLRRVAPVTVDTDVVNTGDVRDKPYP